MIALDEKSKERLAGVKPDLQKVINKAAELSEVQFRVIEGLRTLERQKYLLKKGATRTLRSRHITGHAVDIAPYINGQISWDWKYYNPLSKVVKKAAAEVGIPIEWGGDWKTFKDGPHWQLPVKQYPA